MGLKQKIPSVKTERIFLLSLPITIGKGLLRLLSAKPIFAQHKLLAQVGPKQKIPSVKTERIFQLSHQGSNLDSFVPKTNVLPVTPWDIIIFYLSVASRSLSGYTMGHYYLLSQCCLPIAIGIHHGTLLSII